LSANSQSKLDARVEQLLFLVVHTQKISGIADPPSSRL